MISSHQLRICNELVELYKAQLPFVEPDTAREWTRDDLELFGQRSERISSLQRQLEDPQASGQLLTSSPAALNVAL